MAQQQLTGIIAAVVTPFTPDASAVDVPGITTQVEHILGGGVTGLVPGGSTGEFTLLTMAERKQVNEAYVEAVAGRVPVIAGTGALSTANTVELTAHAQEIGADGVMIVPPFYFAPTFEEILAHLGAVSEATDIPIMYYNIPAATGVELTAAQIAELGRRTNVTSYKDTGGDLPKFTEVLQRHSADILALNGDDMLAFDAFALGAQAGVWGAASILPQQCTELYRAVVVDGDLVRGRELWRKLQPICVFLESHNYARGIKTGLDLVGKSAGPSRRPILPLPEASVAEFRELLAAAGADVTG